MSGLPIPVVVADDGTIIGIKSIESMNFLRNEVDQCADKIRDDIIFSIVTTSGRNYDISSRFQLDTLKDTVPALPPTLEKFKQLVFYSWFTFHQTSN